MKRLAAWLPVVAALLVGATLLLWCALAAVAGPTLGGHHGVLGAAGPEIPVPFVWLGGDIVDLSAVGAPDAPALELSGRGLATGALGHAGYTLVSGRWTTTMPTRSLDWRLAADARWIVSEDAAPAAGAAVSYALSPAGAPLLEVQGTLTAPAAGLAIRVSGDLPTLPAPLLIAHEIAGDLVGDLPDGTALDIRRAPGFASVYLILIEASP